MLAGISTEGLNVVCFPDDIIPHVDNPRHTQAVERHSHLAGAHTSLDSNSGSGLEREKR